MAKHDFEVFTLQFAGKICFLHYCVALSTAVVVVTNKTFESFVTSKGTQRGYKKLRDESQLTQKKRG